MSLLLLMGDSGFNPATLFSNGEQGAWYDPSDFSTMYTDSAGTTPVTAVGDLVGRINDKSGRGNNAVQATSGNRPSLARVPFGGRRNLLNWTEAFDNADWQKVKTGTALIPVVTANTAIAPDGTLTADTVVFDLAGGSDISQLQQAPTLTSQQYTWSFYAKTTDGTSKVFQLAGPVGTGTNITITGDWQRFSQTGTGNGTCRVRLNGGAIPSTASAASIHLWGAQLETGSTATNYQKVTIAGTVADVTESGQRDCYYLDFASNKSLATSAIDFSAYDEMTVIAGVRKVSDAALAVVCELSATIASNNGAFLLSFPNGASTDAAFRSKGTAETDAVATSLTAPLTRVLTGQSDISGDSCLIRVNGVQGDSDTGDQGTGNFGNAALYLASRAGSGSYMTGHIYQLIIRGKTTADSVLRQAERHVATRTGVTL